MKACRKAIIAALFAVPALALAQTDESQPNNTVQSDAHYGANNSEQAGRRLANPDDSIVGLGPIFKNP